MSHFTSRIRLIFIKIFSALRLSNFFFFYEEAIRYWSFPEMLGEYKSQTLIFLKKRSSFNNWREKAVSWWENDIGTMTVITSHTARCPPFSYIYISLKNWQKHDPTKKNIISTCISTTKNCHLEWAFFLGCVSTRM